MLYPNRLGKEDSSQAAIDGVAEWRLLFRFSNGRVWALRNSSW